MTYLSRHMSAGYVQRGGDMERREPLKNISQELRHIKVSHFTGHATVCWKAQSGWQKKT